MFCIWLITLTFACICFTSVRNYLHALLHGYEFISMVFTRMRNDLYIIFTWICLTSMLNDSNHLSLGMQILCWMTYMIFACRYGSDLYWRVYMRICFISMLNDLQIFAHLSLFESYYVLGCLTMPWMLHINVYGRIQPFCLITCSIHAFICISDCQIY